MTLPLENVFKGYASSPLKLFQAFSEVSRNSKHKVRIRKGWMRLECF